MRCGQYEDVSTCDMNLLCSI